VGWLGRSLVAALAAEQDRLFHWLPVLFGGGLALYFALPAEPPLWLCLGIALAGLVPWIAWRQGLAALVVGGAVASAALGFAAGKLATEAVRAPVLTGVLRAATVTGWVEQVEPRAEGGERITLAVAAIEGLDPDHTPRRVRVRAPASPERIAPGDGLRVEANLLPPAGPALPGAFDFGRSAWFLGLGAVGGSRQPPERVEPAGEMPRGLALWAPVERLRQRMSRRITDVLPGETGAIAAALITGERGGISETTNQAYRDSGIFHILSISGLHMTIFAGAVYVSCRFLLALWPALALRFEIKKWAAVAGLLGTSAYLLISGGTPPAVRSAIMLSIMFVAVLLDRPALALRNVALAALVILVLAPQSIVDVGFQMSFAAVVALISGVEAWQAWLRSRGRFGGSRSLLGLPLRVLGAITLTTLIATAAVAPFAVYHFHKSSQFAVLANLAAIPMCNIVVMPAALATLVAMPFGLEAGPLWVMGQGIDAMTWVAERVAQLPGAVTPVPAIPTSSFALMVAGGLWLCLWSGGWRLAGLLPIAAGLALAPTHRAPDVLAGASGALVGVRGADGRLAVLQMRRATFELARWLEHDADTRAPKEVGPGETIQCDATGCQATTAGARIAIARHPAALVEACARAHLVIWLGRGSPGCEAGSAARLLTRAAIEREGTHAVYVDQPRAAPGPRGSIDPAVAAGAAPPLPPPRLRIETVAGWRGNRPWSEVRPARRPWRPSRACR
jgi:competence protein ComEC